MIKLVKDKISIIVCVYNTEKYIPKCLDRLLNQTYSNLEIVVVNDGSTDGSLKILKQYAKKYDKIVLLSNERNQGLSYSRNVGLKYASGEYIGYIDSDDYIDETYYEKLMEAIQKNQSDMAVADMKIIYENQDYLEHVSKGCEGEVTKLNLIKNGLAASACNKLFKKELISRYPFSEGKVNEDLAVVLPAIVAAGKVSYVPSQYYYYVQRGNSIQNSRFSDKKFDIFYGVELTLERIQGCEDYEKIKQAIVFEQLIVLLLYVIPKEKNILRRRNILKKFNQYSKKYNIRTNLYFQEFLESVGRKHALYYKLIFTLNCHGFYFFVSILMFLYDVFKSLFRKNLVKLDASLQDLEHLAMKNRALKEQVRISVVVPNYNYSKFLYQRLYSILNQKVKLHEIILLDDCSKDDSRAKIDEIVNVLSKYIKIQKVYNETNSGSAFKQWQKGFELASGDYVWIAEADDYCNENLISKLIKPIIKDSSILISYADTAFIDAKGEILMKTIKPEIDLMKTGHWDHSYVNLGRNEIENYSFLNCTIANVSSCVIKKGNYGAYLEKSGKFKQAGDWLFYVNVMKNGKIAYTNEVLNYYRVHGNNVSSTMDHKKHIGEIEKIHDEFIQEFQLGDFQKKEMKKRIQFLKDCWKVE